MNRAAILEKYILAHYEAWSAAEDAQGVAEVSGFEGFIQGESMTCEELRRITNAPLSNATNAEIASVVQHQIECRKCHAWLYGHSSDRIRHPETLETIADKTLAVIEDPEAIYIIKGVP